jgi:hypothetical protein
MTIPRRLARLLSVLLLTAGPVLAFCTGLCDGDVPDELPLLPATCPVVP